VVGLLAHVGEDCSGAVQRVPRERVEQVLGVPTATDEKTSIEWLSVDDIAALLTELRRNHAAGRSTDES
jgi:hypothetical protein